MRSCVGGACDSGAVVVQAAKRKREERVAALLQLAVVRPPQTQADLPRSPEVRGWGSERAWIPRDGAVGMNRAWGVVTLIIKF